MPRPRMRASSSSKTAFVVVDPRSMPRKHFMGGPPPADAECPSCAHLRLPALLEHLQVGLEPVLDVRRREVAWVDEVALDEGTGAAGAAFHFALDDELARRERIAALHRVDQEA